MVFLNPSLIERLRNVDINFNKFKWSFDDIKRIVKIIEGFLDLYGYAKPSDIYSLIMRIRICYVMECLMNNKNFSNDGVEKVLLNYGLKKEKIDWFFEIYRKIRDNEKIDVQDARIKKEDIFVLIKIVEDYLKKIEDETKKKIGKRN